MKIKFMSEQFHGVATHPAGTVVEVSETVAKRLVDGKVAVRVLETADAPSQVEERAVVGAGKKK